MRGSDERTGELFSYVDIEERVPQNHPLRLIRRIVNEVLAELDGEFAKLYAEDGRPSIATERLLRALLLQAFYTIRSERQLMEQLHYNLLYRWFCQLEVAYCRLVTISTDDITQTSEYRSGVGATGLSSPTRRVSSKKISTSPNTPILSTI